MIIDVHKFAEEERPYWQELESFVSRLNGSGKLTLGEVRRLHYLYQRASSDLAKFVTFSGNMELKDYLENLVSRAYCVMHETREHHRFRPFHWLLRGFPRAFRKHVKMFYLAAAITMLGSLFGAVALTVDSRAKEVVLGQARHLLGDPTQRVAEEQANGGYVSYGAPGTSFYFFHNTRVSLTTLALGFSWGIGSIILLFYNGVILGAVTLDYFVAGQGTFLVGWLLPHGAIEIPAICVAGQAGLILGHAVIGWGNRMSLAQRLRAVRQDVIFLALGFAFMLMWAGGIEACLSQTHDPYFPAPVKIAFGILQLALVAGLLFLCGRRKAKFEMAETA